MLITEAEVDMAPQWLYADGGVISRNPSTVGGTWAYRVLGQDDQVIEQQFGAIIPAEVDVSAITNNLTELYAVLLGLEVLPVDFSGSVCSDSEVTLGRLFWGWRWSHIPMWMHHRYQRLRGRFASWERITPVLLAGHPTRAQLAAGIGHGGLPVSVHNVWCDQACQQAGRIYLANCKALVWQ